MWGGGGPIHETFFVSSVWTQDSCQLRQTEVIVHRLGYVMTDV